MLAADEKSSDSTSVTVWGVVKETGVDDAGLLDFYETYFPFPLYRDNDLALYKAFGSRKIGLTTWNPLRLYRGFKDMSKRMRDKNVTGNYAGEGMIQGGLLIFDGDGVLQYAIEENIGNEWDVDEIRASVKQIGAVKEEL